MGATIVYCALAPSESLVGGAYYYDCRESQCSRLGRNSGLAEHLFLRSEQICGLRPAGPEVALPFVATADLVAARCSMQRPRENLLASELQHDDLNTCIWTYVRHIKHD